MAKTRVLEQIGVEALRRELSARRDKTKALAREPALQEVDDPTLITSLKSQQKVIYGSDDRVDVFQLPAGPERDDVDSVVALFQAGNIIDNGNGTSTLSTTNFGQSYSLCARERFREQPLGAFCSGFLVEEDVIATAGHCVNASNVTNVRFVFGFRMRDAANAETVLPNSEIYRGAELLGRQEVSTGPDWALVRLDRPVRNHRVARVRRSGRVPDGQALHVIGHPVGLPTKFAGGANVRNNSPAAFFVANLDTYGGNSGSPVFNSETHEVEGILVRGETDFVEQEGCTVSLVCPTTGCRGEDVTRTTEFADRLRPPTAWNTNDLSAATGAAAAESDPHGYVFAAQGTQHVVYRGQDSHIHELWWDTTGWHRGNLTASADAPAAAGRPAGYVFAAQGTQHVVYRGQDGHIHELWWDTTGWHHGNLTAITQAPPAAGDPAGYMLDAQGTQHVVYRSQDGKLHELWWDPEGWHYGNLTAATGAPAAAGDPSGYVFDAQNTQHVVYRGKDGQIHELWWDNTGWHRGDLTAITGAPPAAGDPTAYVFDLQGTQHVVYRGRDGHVHELWWDTTGWHRGDLSGVTGAPNAAGDPAAYVFDGQGTQHVVYRGQDGHIHELWWDAGGWHHADLTAATAAPAAAGEPFGYVFDGQGTQHVVFRDHVGQIHELWWA
ncbi:MAG: trypsin-like peptidase domain-containing protein [Polyangiales bacterium]